MACWGNLNDAAYKFSDDFLKIETLVTNLFYTENVNNKEHAL